MTVEDNGDACVQTRWMTERRTVRIPLACRPALGVTLLMGAVPEAIADAVRQLDPDDVAAIARTLWAICNAVGGQS